MTTDLTPHTPEQDTGQAKAAQTAQAFAPGAYVVLYDLDTSSVGGPVYHFTGTADEGGSVMWRGNTYEPFDIQAEGFEWNGRGPLPTPRIRVSNVNRVFSALVGTYGDLLGCTVRRWRVFDRFLDNRPDADPDAHFPVDVYRIERKVSHDKVTIEWELSAALDQEGRSLPGRLVLRDACMKRYRVWDGNSFLYTRATCPYSGPDLFTPHGAATSNPAQDACGKRVIDCRLRFGVDAVLPYGGFPGVARTRIP
ncbi:MAG TPA: phage minor tail protein L [Azospirillum sp.]|nr:phage minor tail protein L [Azospirillum sp.]